MDNGKVNRGFSLKSLLLLTAIVGVFCALGVPWFSKLGEPSKYFVAISLIGYSVIGAIVVVLLLIMRRTMKAKAGKFVSYVKPKAPFLNSTVYLVLLAFYGALLLAFIFVLAPIADLTESLPSNVASARSQLTIVLSANMFGAKTFLVALLAHSALSFYWGLAWSGAELYQNGLCVYGWRFYPWNKIKSYQWSEMPKLWRLNLKVGRKQLVVLCDREQKEETDRTLKEGLSF